MSEHIYNHVKAFHSKTSVHHITTEMTESVFLARFSCEGKTHLNQLQKTPNKKFW